MKLLLHACCAPCAIIPVEELGPKHDVTLYWYNSNIHPSIEYYNRREALDEFAAEKNLPVIDERVYDMNRFIAAVAEDPSGRCSYCYKSRLGRCAQAAVENGFEAFTTTLFYSPYQDHDMIKKAGRESADAAGVMFLEFDWSGRFREGQDRAQAMNLYRQKYCGCIYSEKERYGKKLGKYVD